MFSLRANEGGLRCLLWIMMTANLCGPVVAQRTEAEKRNAKSIIEASMLRAATFFRTKVATHGGYVYFYDSDLEKRWGEGEATVDQIWVQPPGTPTVGLAYVSAYRATQDDFYLDAIRETAHALAFGQLRSGGWTNCIDFDPNGDRVHQYVGQPKRGKNNSSLDDGQTQSALQFLIEADAVLEFQDETIHAAAQRALDALLAVQFPSGAFPQVWSERTAEVRRSKLQPFRAGNFPDFEWRSEGRIKEYWDLPTLNDDVAVYVFTTLETAHRVYHDARCAAAIVKLGDFLVAAQMPEPQPAWAQQYNWLTQPAWARAFEPPAIASHESQGVIELLMDIAKFTGKKEYLEPIPAALQYLEASIGEDRRLSRYYELQTNRPLYMEREAKGYRLTYSDQNLPSHYGWKIEPRITELTQRFEMTQAGENWVDPEISMQEAADVVKNLDSWGRWLSVSDGSRLVGQAKIPVGSSYISSQVFADNLTLLAKTLEQLD